MLDEKAALAAVRDEEEAALSAVAAACFEFPSSGSNQAARRRLRVCAEVYRVWTASCADEGGAAPHWFNGNVDALDEYAAGSDTPATPAPTVRRFEKTPSAAIFAQQLLANTPCIFPVDRTEELWQRVRAWVADGAPDLQRLADAFPPSTCVVATECNTDSPQRRRMTLREYASWWHARSQERDASEPLLYAKDLQFGSLGHAYVAPRLFADDWLGACHDAERGADDAAAPDLRFVYCGPAGTMTPLHSDVWNTHSWSTNVCGRKLWQFVPPSDAHLLFDRWHARLPPSLDASPLLHPRLREARVVELVQHAGEAVFVPSGWVHTVRNLEDCLSVNCNWANASNLHELYHYARAEVAVDAAGDDTRPLQGPPLRPLFLRYMRFVAERELAAQPCAAGTTLSALWSAVTLARVAHVLTSWPELAPGNTCSELAHRCKAALAALGV
jgi:hypothetical protein